MDHAVVVVEAFSGNGDPFPLKGVIVDGKDGVEIPSGIKNQTGTLSECLSDELFLLWPLRGYLFSPTLHFWKKP